jgi:hypothetical protein
MMKIPFQTGVVFHRLAGWSVLAQQGQRHANENDAADLIAIRLLPPIEDRENNRNHHGQSNHRHCDGDSILLDNREQKEVRDDVTNASEDTND